MDQLHRYILPLFGFRRLFLWNIISGHRQFCIVLTHCCVQTQTFKIIIFSSAGVCNLLLSYFRIFGMDKMCDFIQKSRFILDCQLDCKQQSQTQCHFAPKKDQKLSMYQEKTRNHVTGRVLTRLLVFLQAPLVRRLLNVLVNIGSTHQLFRSVPHGHPCCGVVEKDPIIARPHYTPDESRHRYLDSWRSSKRISV